MLQTHHYQSLSEVKQANLAWSIFAKLLVQKSTLPKKVFMTFRKDWTTPSKTASELKVVFSHQFPKKTALNIIQQIFF